MCVGSCPKSKLSAVCLSSALAAGNLPVDQLATPDRTQDCLEKHYLRVGWLGNRVFRSPHAVGPEQLRDDLRDLRCASADQRAPRSSPLVVEVSTCGPPRCWRLSSLSPCLRLLLRKNGPSANICSAIGTWSVTAKTVCDKRDYFVQKFSSHLPCVYREGGSRSLLAQGGWLQPRRHVP